MVLWSVLRSPLVLDPRFVATSQFTCIAGRLAGAGFRLVGIFEQILVFELFF